MAPGSGLLIGVRARQLLQLGRSPVPFTHGLPACFAFQKAHEEEDSNTRKAPTVISEVHF